MWPQYAVAGLFIVVYVVDVWFKANDLNMSTPRALLSIAVTAAVLLGMTLALREGGFW